MKYRINYSKVISQANDISNNVVKLSAQINLLSQLERDCRTIWKGQAADTFISRLISLRSEMNRTVSQMSSLASTIKYCADRIQHEDQEIKNHAVVLKSGR